MPHFYVLLSLFRTFLTTNVVVPITQCPSDRTSNTVQRQSAALQRMFRYILSFNGPRTIGPKGQRMGFLHRVANNDGAVPLYLYWRCQMMARMYQASRSNFSVQNLARRRSYDSFCACWRCIVRRDCHQKFTASSKPFRTRNKSRRANLAGRQKNLRSVCPPTSHMYSDAAICVALIQTCTACKSALKFYDTACLVRNSQIFRRQVSTMLVRIFHFKKKVSQIPE